MKAKLLAMLTLAAAVLMTSCGGNDDKEGLRSLSVTPSTLTLAPGGTSVLSLSYSPSTLNAPVITWTSSDTGVATVDNGTVYAVGAGTAQVIASSEGLTAICNVTVTGSQSGDLTENTSWSIDYKGRVSESDGVYEEIEVEAPDQDYYYLYVIEKSIFTASEADRGYAGDISKLAADIFAELQSGIKQDPNYVNNITNGGSTTAFYVLTHGTYVAVALGVKSDGSAMTGSYRKAEFEVKEETPSAAFSKWLGTWKMTFGQNSGSEASCNVTIRDFEANYYYEVDGFHGFNDLPFKAAFEASTGDLLFYNQYLYDVVDKSDKHFDLYFLGNVSQGSDNFVITQENEVCGYGELSSDGKSAEVKAEKTYSLDESGKTASDYTGMDYFLLPSDAGQNDSFSLMSDYYMTFPATMTKSAESKAPEVSEADFERLKSRVAVRYSRPSSPAPHKVRRSLAR